ncbi:PDR/VanB family oxidoreductase [Microbacterium sp. LMC-P-041]|uniref:PDR/VanB family oxidoreductase n=1 Tax=Microbacterium sp. LMC-P-041 TaxID=3040293 RepID=UPI002556EBAA|nr:PDR/VanB family oxidoreductase [Microbacterium sp. LMC-P-041]
MIEVLVVETAQEAENVKSLRLVRADGELFPPFRGGAHIDVVGPTGIMRQYSLCSPPSERGSLMIAVKREADSRGGSQALHEVQEGDALSIAEPRNLLALADDADLHMLIGGGIGITPLLAMAYELHDRGERFEVHYFARAREEAAFLTLLEGTASFGGSVRVYIGVPRDEQTAIFAGLGPILTSNSHVYTCGPVGFMNAVRNGVLDVIGEDNFHIEHFEAAEVDKSDDSAFEVELDTGEEFEIPADKSILSVLEENGIEVFKSCEEGICGSCISGVLEGVPDHRDNCLSAAEKKEGDKIALCVSRSLGRKLLIELY